MFTRTGGIEPGYVGDLCARHRPVGDVQSRGGVLDHLVEKVAILAEFSAGAARRPSRAVICGESAFGHILDELLSETYMHRNTEARTH